MKYMHEDLVSEFGSGGGRPSGGYGGYRSTYSDICSTLAKYELEAGKKQFENYINTKAEALLVKLEGLIAEFLDKRHPDASKLDAKKSKEVDAVGELREAVNELAPKRRLWRLLNSYSTVASHPHGGNCELIRNSMKGWIHLLSQDTYRLLISTNALINAEITSDKKISIHVDNFFATRYGIYERGDFVPVGILVHEYHHHLTRVAHAGKSVYSDEFVAHWKQYDAMGIISQMGRAACVHKLNNFILDDGDGYKRRFEVPAGSEFKGPEGAGAAYWDDHRDNAR